MKTIARFLIAAVLLTAAAFPVCAQNAREAVIKYNKGNANAIVADYEGNPEVVEAALRERLSREELGKMKSSKGYMLFPATVWKSVSSDKVDVYFKVEGKKNKSTISVLVSKGYDNFVTSGSDSRTIDNVKAFLNSFADQVTAYQASLNVKAQEEAVKKAEERHKKIAEQQEALQKEQAEKQKALDTEKQKLNELKAKAN